ncbi:MAG: Peptidase M10A and M12B matrixin and adamalysin [Nitrosopumilales archaeon]|nr:MAG: Peptidase M10A and M12B matrixin and adamalysin [Nitrosopumilales archaeon]
MKALVAIFVSLILLSSGVMVISPAIAIPDNASDKAKVKVPENAVEIAPGIFSLGSVIHHGEVVEGLMVFHHRAGHSGGPGGGGGGDTTGDDSKCFTFLAKGAKWKGEAEPWIVNPSNSRGLTESDILTHLSANIEQWEDASGTDILGAGAETTDDLVADTTSPDDKNEVYFADVDSPGAIAVTIVWGHFSGPPFARDLIEWDQVYDDVDYDWSLDAPNDEGIQMDFDNIAAHELGHTVGMGHSPTDDTCLEQTMYPTAAFEEIIKRSLELGDRTGVSKLYS